MSTETLTLEHLDQTARDLVAQFEGFSLVHDWPALARLGSGVLWVDLASGQTHHNGRRVEPLTIARILQAWLRESLAHVQLPLSAVRDATLTAQLTIERYTGARERGVEWAGDPTAFVGCRADVRCRLAVAGLVAEASRLEVLEWPAVPAA